MTTEYRLSYWAGIVSERQASGLTIKEFCRNAGYHENRYYYWLKRLRASACESLLEMRSGSQGLAPTRFAEVKVAEKPASPALATTSSAPMYSHVSIEAAGIRIYAGEGYPAEKLSALLREVLRVC